jgi:hypothetical protein
MYTILLLPSHAIFRGCSLFYLKKCFRLIFFLFLTSFANFLELILFNMNANWNILIYALDCQSTCTSNGCTRLAHASAQFSYLIELTDWGVLKFRVPTNWLFAPKRGRIRTSSYYVIDFLEYEMQVGNFVTERNKARFLWICQAIIFPSVPIFKILTCHHAQLRTCYLNKTYKFQTMIY